MTNHGVQNGIFAGLVGVVLYLLYWFINPNLLFNMTLGLIVGLGVYAFFMWRAGSATKEDNSGYLTFKQALKPTFLTFVIGSLIAVIFTYLLYNFIDPTLNDLLQEKSIEMAEKAAKMFGADEEALEQIREQVEAKGVSMSIGQIIQQYLVGLIFPGFILALIVSAIIKKNPPQDAIV
jgi:small-conductance mechanosensitive channel